MDRKTYTGRGGNNALRVQRLWVRCGNLMAVCTHMWARRILSSFHLPPPLLIRLVGVGDRWLGMDGWGEWMRDKQTFWDDVGMILGLCWGDLGMTLG